MKGTITKARFMAREAINGRMVHSTQELGRIIGSKVRVSTHGMTDGNTQGNGRIIIWMVMESIHGQTAEDMRDNS